MDHQNLYSIRMRASAGGRHISGAERIVASERISAIVMEVLSRARKGQVQPDTIAITIDTLATMPLRRLTALDVETMNVSDMDEGRTRAAEVLQAAGVSSEAIQSAVHYIGNGASSCGALRGAMVMDSKTGERLEPDRDRGIRASRFDWTDEAYQKIQQVLWSAGLIHQRTREALALATKVAHAPAMIAELCWSDDPEYTAGYVASLHTGYVRFPFLKQIGDEKGGRAFFVDRDRLKMDDLVNYLQYEPVLISDVGSCRTVPAGKHSSHPIEKSQ